MDSPIGLGFISTRVKFVVFIRDMSVFLKKYLNFLRGVPVSGFENLQKNSKKIIAGFGVVSHHLTV